MNNSSKQSLQQYYCNLFGLLWHTLLLDRLQFKPRWHKALHSLEPQIIERFLAFDQKTRTNTTAFLGEYSTVLVVEDAHWQEAISVLEIGAIAKAAGGNKQ